MGISIGYSGRNHRKTESQSAAAPMGAALRVRNKGCGAYRRRGGGTPPYRGQEVPTAGRRGRRPLRGVTRNAARDRRDDVGIVRYGVGKTIVGRGQCAPPLGVQYVSAAAHMGAALQRNLQNMRRGDGSAPPVFPLSSMQAGGVEPRPYAGQDGFRKNVIPRSEATWESVFPVWQGCGVGVLRIATPACGLVRNDRDRGRVPFPPSRGG